MNAFAYQSASSKRVHSRWEGDCNDAQFLELMRDLRTHGGLLPVEEIRAVCHVCNPESSLSQYLMQNMLFFIIWRRKHWMPCFQLSSKTWLPCPAVSILVQDLRPLMGGADLAMWFTRKEPALDGHSPLELLQCDLGRVRQFARKAHFPLGLTR